MCLKHVGNYIHAQKPSGHGNANFPSLQQREVQFWLECSELLASSKASRLERESSHQDECTVGHGHSLCPISGQARETSNNANQ